MTAMELLRRCKDAPQDIARLLERIERRRDALTRLSPGGGPGRGGSPADRDKIASMIAEIDMLERQIAQRRQAREAEVTAATTLLDRLPEAESAVLHKYYIMGRSVLDIAARSQRSESSVRRDKRSGEDMMGQIDARDVAATLPPWYPVTDDDRR